MNRWINYVAFLAVGIAVGAVGEHLGTLRTPSEVNQEWQNFISNHEEGSKHRISAFQDALLRMQESGSMGSVQALSKNIATQLQIEELIIKSKEAEHAQFALYGPLMVPVVAAAVGALTSLFVAALGSKTNSAR